MKKAFTLIELLIVIAILAILAVGIIAAIDPVEQFNRGKDAGIVNTAEEYKKAVDRYYTARSGNYPTSISAGINQPLSNATALSSINELVAAGELKTTFTSGNVPLSSVIVNMPAGGPLTVCTLLVSKSFRGNTNALYTSSGAGQAGCPNAASAACSICFF